MTIAERIAHSLLIILLMMAGCIAPTYTLPIRPEALPEPAFDALISDPSGRAVYVTLICDPADAGVLRDGVGGWYLMEVE